MATCKVNTLQSLYPELVEGLQFSVGSLSDEFYAKGMIGMDTYRDIARRHEPGAAEIRLLLMEVTKNIDQKNNFESFINILQQDTSNSCLADLVIKKHKELLQGEEDTFYVSQDKSGPIVHFRSRLKQLLAAI